MQTNRCIVLDSGTATVKSGMEWQGLCLYGNNLKNIVVQYLSFSAGTQPRSIWHIGHESTSSSVIFSRMHFLQTDQMPHNKCHKRTKISRKTASTIA